jgi:hypothetical protein
VEAVLVAAFPRDPLFLRVFGALLKAYGAGVVLRWRVDWIQGHLQLAFGLCVSAELLHDKHMVCTPQRMDEKLKIFPWGKSTGFPECTGEPPGLYVEAFCDGADFIQSEVPVSHIRPVVQRARYSGDYAFSVMYDNVSAYSDIAVHNRVDGFAEIHCCGGIHCCGVVYIQF